MCSGIAAGKNYETAERKNYEAAGRKSYGIITDIQRFSLNDGPGIRTTVFFKGCNLSCKWCHNPETIRHENDLLFYSQNCIGCSKCIDVCPNGAHEVIGGSHVLNRSKCVVCGKCASVCYAEALVISGKRMSVDDVMQEVLQDKPYYVYSGGGVTLSGGEVLCQMEFAGELIKACKDNGISVAIESNLAFPFEMIEPLISKADLLMTDIKLYDDNMHKEYTGMDNAIILDNIKRFSEMGIPLIVRTPLIPGVTDTEKNLRETISFLKSLNIFSYELMNFNPLGASKYEALDEFNTFSAAEPLPEKRLEEIKAMCPDYVIKVK